LGVGGKPLSEKSVSSVPAEQRPASLRGAGKSPDDDQGYGVRSEVGHHIDGLASPSGRMKAPLAGSAVLEEGVNSLFDQMA
jgi:hypothetical protein